MSGKANHTNKSKVHIGEMMGASSLDEGFCGRMEMSSDVCLREGTGGLGVVGGVR